MFLLKFEYSDRIDDLPIDVVNGKFAQKTDSFVSVFNPSDLNFQNQFNLRVSMINENSQIPSSEIQLTDMLIPVDDRDLGIDFVEPQISEAKAISVLHKNITGDNSMIKTELFDSSRISAVDRAFFIKSTGDLFALTVRMLSTDENFFNRSIKQLGIENGVKFSDIQGDIKKTIRVFGNGFDKLSSGTKTIMEKFVRDRFFDPMRYNEATSPDAKNSIKIAYDNFNALMKLANPILVLTTGIYIRDFDYDGTMHVDDNVTKEQEELSEDDLTLIENESLELGAKEMNYSLKVQNISAIQNMTAKLRSIFETLFEVDNKGVRQGHEKYFTIPIFLNSTATIDKVLRLVSGSEDSEVMFNILHEYENELPFISTVLARIEKDQELRRNFWNAFNKRFNPMLVINSTENDEGVVEHKIISANEKSSNTYYSESRMQLYNNTNPSLIFSIVSEGDVDYVVNMTNVSEKEEITKRIVSLRKKTNFLGGHDSWVNNVYNPNTGEFNEDEISSVAQEISDLSSLVGSRISVNLLANELKRGIRFKDDSKIKQLIDIISDVRAIGKRRLSDFLDKYYKQIDKVLDLIPGTMTNQESMTKEAGKSFYSYISDSYIDRRISKLTDSINRVLPAGRKISKADDYIDSEFGRSYMLNVDTTGGLAKFRIPWLNWLYKNDASKETLKKFYIPMCNKTEFSSLSDFEYAMTFLALYNRDVNENFGIRTAIYTVPLYSNKGVYEAVRAYSYSRNYNNFRTKLNTFNDEEFQIGRAHV